MDQIGKAQAQILALINARNELLNRQPTDMVAVAELNERIIDIAARMSALLAEPEVEQLTEAQIHALQKSVDDLNKAVEQSLAVSQILAAITALLNA